MFKNLTLSLTVSLVLSFNANLFSDQAISPQNYGPEYLYPSNPSARLYKLPWTAGKTFQTWDGYGSEPGGSHHPDYSIDFGTPEGEPVLCARGGIVSLAYGADSVCNIATSQGNKVVILHQDSVRDSTAPSGWRKARVMDLYLHVQKNIPVKSGQRVEQGQIIAYSSCTGQDGGVSHIHFKAYIDNSFGTMGYYTHKGWFDFDTSYTFTSIPTPFVEVTNHPNGLSEQGDRLVSQNTVVIASEKSTAKQIDKTPTLKAYPNPGKTATKFYVSLPANDNIKIKLYTLSGQLKATVFDGNSDRIANGTTFSTEGLPAGIYVAALYSSRGEESRIRLNIIK